MFPLTCNNCAYIKCIKGQRGNGCDAQKRINTRFVKAFYLALMNGATIINKIGSYK